MSQLQSAPIVRFSEFMGIGYFGDSKQHVVAPIFDQRHNAESAWAKVTESQRQKVPAFHAVFVEHSAKYEFVAYPVELAPDRINYALFRSFSSLDSMHKFRDSYNGKTYLKFGWHDLTRPQKFDVLAQYARIDSVEFLKAEQVAKDSILEQVRKNQ
ncbi:MAG TPA: hypothetical protein VJP79_07475 [Nitrososphaera sp.]|nr:hypothetical protein [Nitrososphaera sp.]